MATRKTTPTKSKASSSDSAASKAKRFKKGEPQPEAASTVTPETVDSPAFSTTLDENGIASAAVATLAEVVSATNGSSPELDDEISRLAYSYWVERGCTPGDPLADWLRAESEVRTRRVLSAAV
jgi:hypothetical protein